MSWYLNDESKAAMKDLGKECNGQRKITIRKISTQLGKWEHKAVYLEHSEQQRFI